MKHVLPAIFLVVFFTNLRAQIEQTARYEIDKKFTDENFIVISVEENGIILLRESDEKVDGEKGNAWQIVKLDNALNEQWDRKLVVDYRYTILGYEYHNNYLYLLFEEEFSGRQKEFYILKINQEDGFNQKFEISTDLEIAPTHLLINDEQMVLGGEINYRLTFVILNFKEDKVIVVPGFFNRKSIILDFNYNEEHQVYNILLAEKNAQNRNQLVLRSFNSRGKIFIDENYLFDEEIRALNGKINIGDDMKVYFSGSYGGFNSYYSQGIYFGVLQGGKEPIMQFHDLTKFEHIFDYMPEKRAAKIISKIEDGIARNKPYEFKTQLWVQEFKEHSNYFSLLSDIYRPDYKDSSNTPYGHSENPDDETNQKYVTYTSGITNTDNSNVEYFESILMLIDKNGKLLNDMSLPTPGVESLTLDRLSATHVTDSGASILYKDENNIKYKIFDTEYNEMYDSLQQIDLFTEGSTSIKMTDNEGRIEYWYNKYFFVWGYQRIEEASERKRTVFFINKISIKE